MTLQYSYSFNRSINLTDFDNQLMGLILHKGSPTNSGHYLSMVKVGDIWFECDDTRITKIEFNHFYNSYTVYMIFYKRSTWWKHLRSIGLVPMDAACGVSQGEGIETSYSTGSSWKLPSMHCLLSFTFVTFLILWPLSSAASSVLLISILSCLFWNCIWNIQWRWSLYIHILCGLLSCDSSPICKKCWSCFCIPLHS